MGITAGSLNSTIVTPLMDLPYEIVLWRAVRNSSQPGAAVKYTYTQQPARISCDVIPLKDEVYFLLEGMDAIASMIFHFNTRSDVMIHDKVQIYGQDFAGDPCSYYEIIGRVNPTTDISYLRCHARKTDAPSQG